MKNKIGWCDMTFNPCWGCRNKCPYCYARGIAKRFWKKMYELEAKSHFERHPTWAWTGDYLTGLKDFKPTFLYSQYCKKFPKKPQRIFVGSMSEIAYWKDEWVEIVIERVKQYPQHNFQFLTKFPDTYSKWEFPQNCWLGVTVTNVDDLNDNNLKYYHRYIKKRNIKFLCLEPLLSRIPLDFMQFFDWVIIGAETGNRKGKIIPKKEWVEDIVDYCRKDKIPVYLKDSLRDIYPEEIKMFPEVK